MKHRIICSAIVALTILGLLSGCNSKPGTPAPAPVAQPPVDVAALRAKAEQGDASAQARLASLYVKGEGVTSSYVEAAKWFRLAADQGNTDAQAGLGELYDAGRGVPQNMDEALKLYRLAADHGNAGAQYTMGFLYESGRGVRQDHTEAAKWFRLAAEQGDMLSQYDLGQRCELGVGVAVDRVEALKWFTLAAAQGQADATQRAARIQKNMTREEIAEARRRAAAFSPKNSNVQAK